MSDEMRNRVSQAVTSGDLRTLEMLVSMHGAESVRLDTDPAELTALHWAAGAGQLAAVKYLLTEAVGADPRAARTNNFTPLHAGAMHGHVDVCGVLLKAGADVNAQTAPQGYAPLHSAAFGGHVEVVTLLLAHGANPELTNYRNERPVDSALRQNQLAAAMLLRTASSKKS